jgi:hypothetical protein
MRTADILLSRTLAVTPNPSSEVAAFGVGSFEAKDFHCMSMPCLWRFRNRKVKSALGLFAQTRAENPR